MQKMILRFETSEVKSIQSQSKKSIREGTDCKHKTSRCTETVLSMALSLSLYFSKSFANPLKQK